MYSSSWAAGMFFDVEFQELTYAEIAAGHKVKKTANWLALLIVTGFIGVCFAMTLPKIYFWVALMFFCVIDVLSSLLNHRVEG